MRFNILLSAAVVFVIFFLLGARDGAVAQGILVKGSSPAVYYVGTDGRRYVFPNDKTYFTWYADFSGVTAVSDAQLASYAIGGNVTYRPGTRLVKIQSDPKVYAVDAGGVLRWVKTEPAAAALFGSNWSRQVDDLSDSFFVNYTVGADIVSSSDFSPAAARQGALTIDSDKKFNASGTNGNVNAPVAPVAPAAPTGPVCGNGKVEGTEQCDGGDRCSTSCAWTTKYQALSFDQPGGSSDYIVGIGDKIAIGDGINIRIDDISNASGPNGYHVDYSIWGKDANGACKLVSASGQFWTNLEGYDFREFADSFLEIIGVDGAKATIRQYYGNAARVRCDAIAGWKQPLACSMYPSGDHYLVSNGAFNSFFYGTDDQLAAEYYDDAFMNCRQAYLKKIPALSAIAPIGRSYRQLYSALEDVNAYSTDYERVFISKSNYDPASAGMAQKLGWISDNSCPMQESAIAHELAHMLFARTFLQGSYDGGTKPEWTDANAYKEPGSITAQEGFAQYMTTFISKDSPSAAAKTSSDYWGAFCGKDRLLNAHPGDFYDFSKATADQMSYKNIFEGSGYQANIYQAGYCFYERIDDDCGDASFTDLLNKAIQYDGSTASHPTMFKYLSDNCGTDKIASIMNDFGFDKALIIMTQKWPNTGFPNGLDQSGCLSN